MNPHLEKLLGLMGSQYGTSEQEVLNALFMIRAHWSLAGLVICCQRITDLVEEFPEIATEQAFDDQDLRLKVIRQIGQLAQPDPHFLDAAIKKRAVTELPLWPYTGDSGLCDVLLIQPNWSAKQSQFDDVLRLTAWFTWQIFHYQSRRHSFSDYLKYLRGDGSSTLRTREGRRVYDASLVLRKMADSREAVWAGQAAEAFTPFVPEVFMRMIRAKAQGERPAGNVTAFGGAADEPESAINSSAIYRNVQHAKNVDPYLGRFLELIWLPKIATAQQRAANREDITREIRRLDVIRFGSVYSLGFNVPTEITPDGFAIEIHQSDPELNESGGESEVENDVAEEGDPQVDVGVEPKVTLFLGDGDLMSSFYAAKSASHHIERANAMLPWPQWRLSLPDLKKVASSIRLDQDESVLQRRARLTIGLSLVTGRLMDDVEVLPIIADVSSDRPPGVKLFITLWDHTLHVVAGTPRIDRSKANLPQFCAPWTDTIRLPLPQSWWPLLHALAGQTDRPHASIRKAAQKLMGELRLESKAKATPKAIAGALKLALLKSGRDDLGLLKVVTDANDANLNNVIHYYSFPRNKAERIWHEIVSEWVRTLPELPSNAREDERVGCPQSFEVDKVAELIAQIKTRFHEAVREQRWDSVCNLLILYLSLWFGMALASRKTKWPVPGVITKDGWALTNDKHRPDGSTDRYVPLRETLLEQTATVHSLISALSILYPEYSVPPAGADHLLALRVFLQNGETRPFQPKYHNFTSILRNLPGNWGRKLVRSYAPELFGRFKDAGMGHWVRGRHPWTFNSTFPSQEFCSEWLGLQERLEQELGFEVLTIPGLPVEQKPWVYTLPKAKAPQKPPEKIPTLSVVAIELLLLDAPEKIYQEALDSKLPHPNSVLALAVDAVRRQADEGSADLAQDAEAICEYLRNRTQVPIFAKRPRKRFQINWLVKDDEFQCLAYFEQHLLPSIEQDLARLPTRDLGPSAVQQDIGRMIVVAALRGGVVCTAHMESLLEFVAGDRPIQAVGEARLIELQVRSQRSKDRMRRTVILEPYFATFISVERDALRDAIGQVLNIQSDKRRHHWNSALRAYLKSLDVPADITVAALLGAIRQRIQLSASPVLAAYASGEVLTEDLSVAEFRRLVGLARVKAGAFGDSTITLDDAEDEDEREELPKDVADADFAAELFNLKNLNPRVWQENISKVRGTTSRKTKLLLCNFAMHILDEYALVSKEGNQLKHQEIATLKHHLIIVWAGLAGFSGTSSPIPHLDEKVLQFLFDLTMDHFPIRRHHGAWSRFRKFLADKAVDHSDIRIGEISEDAVSFVSAKVLSDPELVRITELIASIRSRIGTVENRTAAGNHFAITLATGARRAEVESLRWEDLDDDMIRIRPYDLHTLKTVASERVVPRAILDQSLRDQIQKNLALGAWKPIDAGPKHSASGANFFNQVSKAMKTATGDNDIGPHHLRHTKASALSLAMLSSAVDLKLLDNDFPWVAGILPAQDQRDALLGTAGQCGQGLQTISALLGHLHESTTLKHYVHTMGIGLYAYQLGLPKIPLQTAFEQRISSRASLYRFAKQAQENKLSDSQRFRYLRNQLESLAQRDRDASSPEGKGADLVFRNETPLQFNNVVLTESEDLQVTGQPTAQSQFEYFELAHRYLTGQGGPKPEGSDALSEYLKVIAAIPSGKPGAKVFRHPMEPTGYRNAPRPRMLLSGIPVVHATILLGWLQKLKLERPDDYHWLISKWLYASDRLEGSMRLDGADEHDRVRAMNTDASIILELRPESVAKNRKGVDDSPKYRLRIRFAILGASTSENEESYAGRGSGAVRWVLTWMAALEGVGYPAFNDAISFRSSTSESQ